MENQPPRKMVILFRRHFMNVLLILGRGNTRDMNYAYVMRLELNKI